MADSGQRIAHLAAEVAEAGSPLDALRKASELRRELDGFEREQVAFALAEGATFAGIARDLGVSRQAVHRRFRDLAGAEELSADARRILRDARDAASALGVRSPASEHVLLATLGAADLPAAALLRSAGASLNRARALAEGLSVREPLFRRGRGPSDPLTLMTGPVAEARRRGAQRIEAEDLLIGLLSDESAGAARILRTLGVDLDVVRLELGLLRDSRGARRPAQRTSQ
jgi:ATP-dependent Clp protease ATP-binding subunit ClpA